MTEEIYRLFKSLQKDNLPSSPTLLREDLAAPLYKYPLNAR